MFYEMENSLRLGAFKVEEGKDFSFPAHFHSDFELVTVIEGEMLITVEKTPYTLKCGDALMIFPNQIHEFFTSTKSRHILCVFSPDLVQVYSKAVENKVPVSNHFKINSFYIDRLRDTLKGGNLLLIKGILYSACSDFDKNAKYNKREIAQNELLKKIFEFVESNYNKKCSLTELSLYTSRHYTYLSKFFKESTGFSFGDYVRKFRIRKACYILQYETQTILETAYDCGFDSLRTFNRNFKSDIGNTPSAYRKSFHRNIPPIKHS